LFYPYYINGWKREKENQRRLSAGETDRLETTNLELIALQWKQDMMLMQTMLRGISAKLTAMMRSNEPLYPQMDWKPNLSQIQIVDEQGLENHPMVQWRQQELKASQMNTKVEKAMNNAEWYAGVNTISVTGWQTSKDGQTETFFDIGNRFFSGTVGLHVPIFAKGQRAKVAAAAVQEKVAANRVDLEKYQLQTAYQQNLAELQGIDMQLKAFEKESLPRVDAVMQALQRKLNAGSINYLEFNIALQQLIQANLQHVELQRLLGEKIIDLQYFTQEL
jgi:heavy metal efflux system protein